MMSALQMDISTSPRFQRLNSTDRESDDVAIDYSKSASRVMPEARVQASYRVPTKGMRKAYPEDQYVSQSPHHHHHHQEQQYQKPHQVASPDLPRMEQSSPYSVYSQLANSNNNNQNPYYPTPPPQPYNDHKFNYGYESEELREYQCLKCGLIFSSESDLHVHYTHDHGFGQSNGGSNSTTSCSSNSGVNGANRQQQSSRNSSSSQDMFCDKCQLRFHCPLSFRVHQHEHVLPNVQPHYPMSNSHLLSLSYTCEICSANFMSRESLTDHCNAHLYVHICSESTCGESDSTATNSSEDFYPRESSHHSQHPGDQYLLNKGYLDQGGDNEIPQLLLHHHQQQQQIEGKADHEQLIVNQGPTTYSSEYSSSYQHEISPPISSSKSPGIYEPLIVMDNGKRRFQCVICKKYLSSRIAHEEHTRGKHTGEKPYSCSYCGKRFSVFNTFKHHLSTHKGGVTPLQKCRTCDKAFKTIECLRGHMQREHNIQGGNNNNRTGDGNGNAGYSCQICGKLFVRKMWRTRHYLSHAGQNCFRCELCSCILPDEQSYRMHHESHKASK